jgi:hypothetical protein
VVHCFWVGFDSDHAGGISLKRTKGRNCVLESLRQARHDTQSFFDNHAYTTADHPGVEVIDGQKFLGHGGSTLHRLHQGAWLFPSQAILRIGFSCPNRGRLKRWMNFNDMFDLIWENISGSFGICMVIQWTTHFLCVCGSDLACGYD